VRPDFFICDLDYVIKFAQFKYENTLKVAIPIYNMIKDKLLKGRELLMFDGEFNENILLSSLFIPEIMRINLYLQKSR
jgi:hypothetical protein